MDASVEVNPAGDGVEVIVLLPPGVVSSAQDVNVEVLGDDSLLVEGPGGFNLQVPLPLAIDLDTGRVRYRKATGKLIFTAFARNPSHAQAACTDPQPEVPLALGPAAAAARAATGKAEAAAAAPAAVASSPSAITDASDPASGAATRPANSTSDLGPGSPSCSTAPAVHSGGGGVLSPHELGPRLPVTSAAGGAATSGATAAEAAAPASHSAGPAVGAPLEAAVRLPPTPPGCPAAAHEITPNGPDAARDKVLLPTSAPAPVSEEASDGSAVPVAAAAAAAAPAVMSDGRGDSAAVPHGGPGPASGPPTLLRLHSPGRPTSPASVSTSASADDAALYAEFYCDSPPAMPPDRRGPLADPPSPSHPQPPPPASSSPPPGPPPSACSNGSAGTEGAGANAGRVAAAFAPTGGTSSRDAGFSFTAPELPAPPPLPAGLPPVAPPIDCRYLAVANGLRVSAHSGTAALAELLGVRKKASAAAERRKADRVAEVLQRVADTLDAYGYAVLDNYISDASIQSARKELRVMEPHYSPGLIWVGKEAESGAQISVSSVRGDVVLWLDDGALNATAFVKDGVRRSCSFMQLQQMLADVDELVFEGLRPRLPYLAGLHRRSDAMMAVYPGKGARFARHVDNTTLDGRRLTVLTYLNPGWREEQGGALRLFPVRPGAAEVVDVLPVAGRVALFLSAEVAHEVMPAFALRHAVTLWYFDAGEHAAALTAARVLPGATSRPSAQAAATSLLRDLLADEAASGIPATPEGCAALGTRVAALEAGAQELLAAVLGLPSKTALVESMRNLTPDSLQRRREELRTMGLGAQHHAPDTSAHV